MANEMDNLLNELRNMNKNSKSKIITNSKDVWSAIGNRDWASAGFDSEEEAMAWIENNPYSNL